MPSIKKIEGWAFSGCSSLEYVYCLADTINYGAFKNCKSLLHVNMFNTKDLGPEVFIGCKNLETVFIPKVKSIDESCFENCTNLKTIIMNGVEYIEDSAFKGCNSLSSVEIPSIKRIKSSAFANTAIKSIVFPQSTESLSAAVFEDTPIRNIEIKKNGKVIEGSYRLVDNPEIVNLIVPVELEEEYKNNPDWEDFYINKRLKINILTDFISTGGAQYGRKGINEIRGVTADGVTKLLIYIKEDIPAFDSSKIRILYNGENVTGEDYAGHITNLKFHKGYGYGFIYTAPKDFYGERNMNKYTLTLTISNESSSKQYATTLDIYRPGILLFHGLNSNQECFAYLNSLLTNKEGYETMQVYNVDYSSSNRASFADNSGKYGIVGNAAYTLYNQLLSNGIVSAKYDLVGHSMGGILSRKYAQEASPYAVNRIITLNTPHSGSKFANYLYSNDFAPLRNILGLATWTIEEGAVSDLCVDSKAIEKLNASNNCAGIPVHAITSYISNQQVEESFTDGFFASIRNLLEGFGLFLLDGSLNFSEMPAGYTFYYSDIFNDDNDGVVSLTSQKGGLTGSNVTIESAPYSGIMGMGSNAYHTKTNSWDASLSRICELLKTHKTSSLFCTNGFHPAKLTYNSLMNTRGTAKTTARLIANNSDRYIHIKVEEKTDSLHYVEVTFEKSTDVMAHNAVCKFQDNSMIIGNAGDTVRFIIPEICSEVVKFYAIGKTADGNYVADSTAIDFTHDVGLYYLMFENRNDLYMQEGQTIRPNVVGCWGNCEEGYVTPEFISSDENVITTGDGMVTAMSEGVCQLVASMYGQTDTIMVHVHAAPKITGITSAERETEPFVDVYNLQGLKLKAHVKREKWSEGLPEGIYIIDRKKYYIR